jgi:hypothetical protein
LKRYNPEAYARAAAEREKRTARKERLPLPLRSAEAKKLLEEMERLKDEELLARYYSGRKPGRIPKKVRSKFPSLLELMKELPKNREQRAGSPAHSVQRRTSTSTS